MQGGGYDPGFHEILCHSPPLHSIKLKTFCETFDFIRFLVDFERPIARNGNAYVFLIICLQNKGPFTQSVAANTNARMDVVPIHYTA